MEAYLSESPLLVFLLQPRHHDRHDREGLVSHLNDDLDAFLRTVDLLQNALVERRATSAETNRQLVACPLLYGQGKHLLRDRLQQLDAFLVRLDVEIVVVTFLFNTMQTFLVTILPMGHKSRVFGRPRRVRRPFIVQNRVTELIATTASL